MYTNYINSGHFSVYMGLGKIQDSYIKPLNHFLPLVCVCLGIGFPFTKSSGLPVLFLNFATSPAVWKLLLNLPMLKPHFWSNFTVAGVIAAVTGNLRIIKDL